MYLARSDSKNLTVSHVFVSNTRMATHGNFIWTRTPQGCCGFGVYQDGSPHKTQWRRTYPSSQFLQRHSPAKLTSICSRPFRGIRASRRSVPILLQEVRIRHPSSTYYVCRQYPANFRRIAPRRPLRCGVRTLFHSHIDVNIWSSCCPKVWLAGWPYSSSSISSCTLWILR